MCTFNLPSASVLHCEGNQYQQVNNQPDGLTVARSTQWYKVPVSTIYFLLVYLFDCKLLLLSFNSLLFQYLSCLWYRLPIVWSLKSTTPFTYIAFSLRLNAPRFTHGSRKYNVLYRYVYRDGSYCSTFL